MARSNTTAHNQDRILQAAERLFAENGFDATSVSSVAQAAEVNKALVYYYFKSKDELLASLFAKVTTEMQKRAGDASDNVSLKDKVTKEVAYLADQRHTLVLMLMQALKQSNRVPALFEAVGELIEGELVARGFPPFSATSPDSENHRLALIHEFFTGIIPALAYVTLRDRFCAHFDLDLEEADKLFIDALESSHFNSHVEPQANQ